MDCLKCAWIVLVQSSSWTWWSACSASYLKRVSALLEGRYYIQVFKYCSLPNDRHKSCEGFHCKHLPVFVHCCLYIVSNAQNEAKRGYLVLKMISGPFLCMFNVPTYQWTAVHKDPLLVLFSITPCYESGSHGLRCYKHLLYMNLFVFCDFIYHRKVTIFIFNTADGNFIWGAHANWK